MDERADEAASHYIHSTLRERIAEHGRPLAERQVGGDDHRGAFVELADEVEQQLAAGTGERQVAKLVEHHEVEPGELGSQGPGLADPGLFLEPVHNLQVTERWHGYAFCFSEGELAALAATMTACEGASPGYDGCVELLEPHPLAHLIQHRGKFDGQPVSSHFKVEVGPVEYTERRTTSLRDRIEPSAFRGSVSL